MSAPAGKHNERCRDGLHTVVADPTLGCAERRADGEPRATVAGPFKNVEIGARFLELWFRIEIVDAETMLAA